ncbi:hypothetical protein BDN71DRAFT_525175 [Pleurotus eryngii]|uniref:Uncharacterized protein n=1 Tax=Pleurotus eryngii TaxID=5323 RepID=A0A9P5ZIM4_PLEER|nr:hypothetical protein BDN71DRAFT_525175 [Pleurotus eryngii]
MSYLNLGIARTAFASYNTRMLSFYKVAAKLDDELAILGDVWKTLTPLVSNFRDAQRVALQRCLPRSQFEYPEPETQLIRHQTRKARQHHTRPCYLVLHLAIEADTIDDSLRVTVATWSALNDPLAFLPPSNSFSSLNHIHLKFPLPTPQDGDRNSSLSGDQDQKELSISISGCETPFSSGANSPRDNVVISSSHRTIIINHIHAIMGDAFLGTINGGNIGGRNNVNSISEHSIDSELIVLILFRIQLVYKHVFRSVVSVWNVSDYDFYLYFFGSLPLFLITVVTTKEREWVMYQARVM